MDFVVLTQYSSQNENTLQYLQHALFWINKLKNVFHHLCSIDLNFKAGHFNISKLHIMTHYAQHICQYNSADNVNTEHSKTAHKYLMKVFYNWMNKWKNFQEQLLNHNFCHLKILAMKNLILWKKMQDSRISNDTMLAFVIQSSWALPLKKICDVQSWRERKQV